MKTGTNHFTSKSAADKYYYFQGFLPADVTRKITNGEIKIGPPQIKDGQKLLIDKNEGRYFIQD